ncbi:hypothetical protein ACFFRR_006668 [Megaselia abdita]
MNSEDDLISVSDLSDCYSINSIPWSDDAIKKNQYDWESIERQIDGKQEIENQEIRQEILDWQQFNQKMLIRNYLETKKLRQRNYFRNTVPMETTFYKSRYVTPQEFTFPVMKLNSANHKINPRSLNPWKEFGNDVHIDRRMTRGDRTTILPKLSNSASIFRIPAASSRVFTRLEPILQKSSSAAHRKQMK